MKHGDILPVEIAGESIGDAVVSEITDDYVEVVFYGHTIKLSTNVLDYFEMRNALDAWGI